MFETGMSALVLKICGEYAKALGLNFPPCVQQEINAIAQYVDLHTVKDLRVEQNGSVVTITCYTEGEQEKVFTVTLPEVNVDVLFNLIKGSSSVVVEKSEDSTHLVIRLAQSVLNDINSKLTKPANPASDSVVTMTADGTVGTKPLSEIGGSGGGKLYVHTISFGKEDKTDKFGIGRITFSFYDSKRTPYTNKTIKNVPYCAFYVHAVQGGSNSEIHIDYLASGTFYSDRNNFEYVGVVRKYDIKKGVTTLEPYSNSGMPFSMAEDFVDVVTER